MKYCNRHMGWPVILLLFVLKFLLFHGVAASPAMESGPVPVKINRADREDPHRVITYDVQVVHAYPHDSSAFTQGLVFDEGYLYEGTGIRSRSSIVRIKPDTGEVQQQRRLPDNFFGEGITIWKDRVLQLTWQSRTGFVYNKRDLSLLQTFFYPTEGWGITHDGSKLIMSDGTAHLYFLDPDTFASLGKIEVSAEGSPVAMLNELECIRGEVYANVWRTNTIVIINPATGRVRARVDLEELSRIAGGDKTVKTLNGIAYDNQKDRLFVTGKLWPNIYEIKLITRRPESGVR